MVSLFYKGEKNFKNAYFRYGSRLRNLRYHFKTAPYNTLKRYQFQLTGSYTLPWLELVKASWFHGASFEEYYSLRFYKKQPSARRDYLTTSLCFDLDLQLNTFDKRYILKDKLYCFQTFKDLLGRPVWSWNELKKITTKGPTPRLVAKYRWGQLGKGIYFFSPTENWSVMRSVLANHLKKPNDYVFEPYFEQHKVLNRLNPLSVNTLQIITSFKDNDIKIWNCILRMGIGEGTDHFSTGGLAVSVDDTGIVLKAAVKKDPFFSPLWEHPESKCSLKGLQIPYFEEAKALAIEAAKRVPDLGSVSWDIAIAPDGPCLLEGNHNWSCQTAQIPRGEGLRHQAVKVADMYRVYG